MGTSEKVPIFAYMEREEGITVPSSQSPQTSRNIAALSCLQAQILSGEGTGEDLFLKTQNSKLILTPNKNL